MVKYYDNRINKHIFEILRPKIKRKKWIEYTNIKRVVLWTNYGILYI
jgi:hypothetical protein